MTHKFIKCIFGKAFVWMQWEIPAAEPAAKFSLVLVRAFQMISACSRYVVERYSRLPRAPSSLPHWQSFLGNESVYDSWYEKNEISCLTEYLWLLLTKINFFVNVDHKHTFVPTFAFECLPMLPRIYGTSCTQLFQTVNNSSLLLRPCNLQNCVYTQS